MRDQCSPCWLTTARDRELIQMQHFCHNGDTICHPNSSYVNVDATIMRCIFTFPTVDVCRERWADSVQAFVVHAKVARCQHCWINYFSCLKFRFCLTTVSNIMIIVNWCSGVACNWCVWLDNGLILALIVMFVLLCRLRHPGNKETRHQFGFRQVRPFASYFRTLYPDNAYKSIFVGSI